MTLILDATTANIAMYALAFHADDREAHVREVERFGQSLPVDSYGRRNRRAIADRENRIAARLRAAERACRDAIEPDFSADAPAPTGQGRGLRQETDWEMEAE